MRHRFTLSSQVVCLVWILALRPASGLAADPPVIINEVLANPLSESTGEFVELFNPGDAPVDVNGWRLADPGDANDTLVDFTGPHDLGVGGTVIPPGGYALIVDPDYAGEYRAFIIQYADLTRLVMLTISGDRTLGNGLGNSGDTIILEDGAGYTAQVAWTSDAGDGVSWEKVHPMGGDGPSNWAASRHPFRSTPGAPNSVTPARWDARVEARDVRLTPPQPSAGEEVTITALVHNAGLDSLRSIQVLFFVDADGDSLPGLPERVGTAQTAGPLAPGDSALVAARWPGVLPGRQTVGVQIDAPGDDMLANNRVLIEVRVAFPARSLVINEIMFDPGEGGAEWVEVFNRSPVTLDLAGWTIENADSTRPRRMATEKTLLHLSEYAVVVSDTVAFRTVFPSGFPLMLVPQTGWPGLRNTGTRVIVRDLTGRVIDWVEYSPAWGGESGRSLERVNPDWPSVDSTGWGSSAAEAGGTPGARNSLFASSLPERMSVDISPNPFSPDGDGHEDQMAISLSLPTPRAVIRLLVYDLAGRPVRVLLDREPAGSRRTVTWDGRDDRGRRARIGLYLLYGEVVSMPAGRMEAFKRAIVLAGRL
ncbi:MAG: lamin tail domain-containing protein [Candidatus Latescibacteria bacterium]|nr:lamin tail domain-containing protein [Candidatus Latescibacterota bacterium]